MKLTPEIEKIALQEAEEVGLLQRKLQGTTGRQVLNFVENFLDALPKSEAVEIFWPEYHDEGMGCGLEDRNITDRYEAMRHGWDCAIERCQEAVPEEIYTTPPIMQDLNDQLAESNRQRDEAIAVSIKHITICDERAERDEKSISELKSQLLESQAREAKLREALESYKWQIEGGLICVPNGSINEALDTPPDATALNELIAKAGEVMRERCVCAVRGYVHWGQTTKQIRALPDVTLEDLNHD